MSNNIAADHGSHVPAAGSLVSERDERCAIESTNGSAPGSKAAPTPSKETLVAEPAAKRSRVESQCEHLGASWGTFLRNMCAGTEKGEGKTVCEVSADIVASGVSCVGSTADTEAIVEGCETMVACMSAKEVPTDEGAVMPGSVAEGAENSTSKDCQTFDVVAVKPSGDRRTVVGLLPNMTVSEFMMKVKTAFGDGDCTFSFQDNVLLCLNGCALTDPSQTLQTLQAQGLSDKTPVTYVTTSELLTLRASDDSVLRVVLEVACMSQRIKAVVDENGAGKEVPLPDCTLKGLIKAMEYCAYHQHNPAEEIQKPLPSTQLTECGVSVWDSEFIDIEQEALFEFTLVANYLDIKSLLGLTCSKIASMIKGKTTEEIRKQFNIVNDFTPEEEAQVREENRWCEDA